MNIKINEDDKCEFIGQLIDIFEDFLEKKGVVLNNEDKEYAIECGEDPDGLAIIYGEDYGDLSDSIEATLHHWSE